MRLLPSSGQNIICPFRSSQVLKLQKQTNKKRIYSPILIALKWLCWFSVPRVGVRRFNEREAPHKLRRDDEAEGRHRQLLL